MQVPEEEIKPQQIEAIKRTVDELIVFEFKNPKQNNFYDTVMNSVARIEGFVYRYLFYGGAIRGGKTFVCLYIFWKLANLFHGSRWHVIREDNPALESTSIPSMEKLIGTQGETFKWRHSEGKKQVILNNGSRIFFMSENLKKDKALNSFLGLETNGVLLEQMEGLSEKLFDRVVERIGSWYIDPMPIPLLLGTFNPTPTWVKKKIYDKYIRNELQPPYYFEMALPDDNPFVTKDQWTNWSNLDEESYNIMIRGIWTFKLDGNIFAYAFDEQRHVLKRTDERMQLDELMPVYLIFDFNVDPITCLVAQKYGIEKGRIIKEYRLRNSDIWELTERIYTDLKDYYLVATGDATGRNRSALTKGNKTYLDIIQAELHLSSQQMQFPLSNPSVRNTRMVLNSVLNKHKDFFICEDCLFLIDDLNTVKTDASGEIDKKKIDPTKTHLLDNLRYFCWNYFRKFVNI